MSNSGLRSDYLRIFIFSLLSALFFILFLLIGELFFFPGVVTSALALYSGSDKLVDESGKISARIGLSNKMEGVLILSLAAVADEFFLTMIAAFIGRGGISFGAVQGSNVFTIASILIMAPAVAVALRLKDFRKDILYLILADVVIIIISYFFQVVPVYFAALFFILFAVYFISSARRYDQGDQKPRVTNYSLGALALSILVIFVASYFLTSYAEYLVYSIHMNEFLSGFLVSGVAGSVPEIAIISLTLKRHKNAASTGVIIGSTIYKLTIILGAVTLVGNLNLEFSKWSSFLLLFLGLIMISLKKDPKPAYAPLIGCIIVAASVLLYIFA